MKKEKAWTILSLVVWIALLLSEVWLGIAVWKLDMLPTKYVALVVGILAVVLLIMAAILFPHRGKREKPHGHVRQIVGYMLSAAVIAACWFGAGAINRVSGTIDKVTEIPEVSGIVNVYVRSDDEALSIEDAKSYQFAVTESYDWDNTCNAVSEIQTLLGGEIATVPYPDVFAMVDALYSGEVDALVLNDAYADIFDEIEGYTDFLERTKVIYEYQVMEIPEQTEAPIVQTEPAGSTSPDEQSATVVEPFLIYLSGSDTRSQVLTTSRSDVNILAVVNPQTRQILLVNTPRDYYVGNPAGGWAKDKLTHCGIYGIDCSMKALEKLYGQKISYYAQINFTGFETLIDALGGVTVYSDVAFTTLHGKYPIHVGYNDLNGAQALGYARERYALSGGDNDRGKNQMKIISAVIEKLSSGETLIANYGQILDSLEGMFRTNLTQKEISTLVKLMLSDMSPWNVQSYAVSGRGGSATTYSMPSQYAYVTYPNESTVNHASKLMERVLAGEILTSADMALN